MNRRQLLRLGALATAAPAAMAAPAAVATGYETFNTDFLIKLMMDDFDRQMADQLRRMIAIMSTPRGSDDWVVQFAGDAQEGAKDG